MPNRAPRAATERRAPALDFKAVGVSADEAAAATRVVTTAADGGDGVVVYAQEDLRRLATHEAERSLAGCGDTGCLAEIPDALPRPHCGNGALAPGERGDPASPFARTTREGQDAPLCNVDCTIIDAMSTTCGGRISACEEASLAV